MADTHGSQTPAGTPPPQPTAYAQDLSRSLGLRENMFITLSSVTPASRVFIILPSVISGLGVGAAALAFALAAVAGMLMAFCYAEFQRVPDHRRRVRLRRAPWADPPASRCSRSVCSPGS
ncbi:hypothetical protein [Embleya sp. NPDC005971]|uniref:hypothetical protein n=1 Tax=Embleya sp. NPDC005971 TaxID=3156724 RepID=UPI0033C96400